MRFIAGWLGGALLAVCSLPLLLRTIADGQARGVSLPFLLMWWAGELLMLSHVSGARERSRPLLLNYWANVAIVGVILVYRVFR